MSLPVSVTIAGEYHVLIFRQRSCMYHWSKGQIPLWTKYSEGRGFAEVNWVEDKKKRRQKGIHTIFENIYTRDKNCKKIQKIKILW